MKRFPRSPRRVPLTSAPEQAPIRTPESSHRAPCALELNPSQPGVVCAHARRLNHRGPRTPKADPIQEPACRRGSCCVCLTDGSIPRLPTDPMFGSTRLTALLALPVLARWLGSVTSEVTFGHHGWAWGGDSPPRTHIQRFGATLSERGRRGRGRVLLYIIF